MRFVDASVFLHAFLKPRTNRRIPPEIEELKRNARRIITRINDEREAAVTSLVHVSEIANILGARMSSSEVCDVISGILELDNLKVIDPSKRDYESAVEDSRSSEIGINGALAWLLMQRDGISEIYSFDGDFDRIEGLERITG